MRAVTDLSHAAAKNVGGRQKHYVSGGGAGASGGLGGAAAHGSGAHTPKYRSTATVAGAQKAARSGRHVSQMERKKSRDRWQRDRDQARAYKVSAVQSAVQRRAAEGSEGRVAVGAQVPLAHAPV